MLKCVCVCVVVMYGFTEGDGEESHPEIRYEAMGDSDHRVGRDLRYEGCVGYSLRDRSLLFPMSQQSVSLCYS